MTWDFDDMLQSFIANGVSGLSNATYEYDAIGRRVAKNVISSGNGSDTTYYVSTGNVVAYEHESLDDAVGLKICSGTTQNDILAFIADGSQPVASTWLHLNRQFSIYAMTDSTGPIIEFCGYDNMGNHAFSTTTGTPIGSQFTVNSNLRFNGRSFDSESQLFSSRGKIHSTTIAAPMVRATFPSTSTSNNSDELIEVLFPRGTSNESLSRNLAHASLSCSKETPCPCTNSENGCKFNIELRGSLYRFPFAIGDLQLVLGFTPTIPLTASPQNPVAQPIRPDGDCFGDFGRSGKGNIEVETSNGTVCKYDSSNFHDPFGYPIEGTLSEECRIIFSKSNGSRPPRGKPPYFQAGSIFQFMEDIVRIKVDFEIETYCGCGPMDELSRPTKGVKSSISVNAQISAFD